MALQVKALVLQDSPSVRSPEPSKMPGCDPSMGKAKTGDPWNDNLAECAGSEFQ